VTNVIVGVDGRPHDADALALAELLHRALDARILLAHVTESEAPEQPDAQEITSRAAETIGVASQTIRTGPMPAADGLCELAQEKRAEILVLGSSHRGPVGRIVPGAVTSRVLARAPCAIAVAPAGYADRHRGSIATIGIAYDTTDASDAALDQASAAAARLGVPLVLYHAMAPVPEDPAWDEFRGHMKIFARGIVETGIGLLPAGVKGIPRVLEGSPGDVVAQAADRDQLGLLFVGSRGYGPVREALMGGVAGRLLQTSRVPLVIVPHGVGRRTGLSSPA
jgi:nucleotide-binding universal stress UspA family protein